MRDVPVVTRPLTLYLIAGEPSGDRLGAALMAGLRLLDPSVVFHGVGGPLMQAQGMQSAFPMQELSVMGIAEVLPNYFALKARIRQCAAAVVALQPDALLTIDSPDFCLRVAGLVRATGTAGGRSRVPAIHYVAPTVWAWRPGRAAKMAQVIDHVLVLFPFEPPYMTGAGMGCTFVGHPVVSDPVAGAADVAQFRRDHSLAEGVPLILALPGSRRGEVARLAPRFGEALALVLARHPTARVLVPTLASVRDMVADAVRQWPGDPVLLLPTSPMAKAAAFSAADVALAASGTVSLELAAAGTPMVIGYDMAWLSRQIIGRMMRLDTVTLVNLVSETRTVPEFLGPRCRADLMAAAVLDLLENPAARAAQQAAMAITMDRLGAGGEAPGLRAARAVLAVVGR